MGWKQYGKTVGEPDSTREKGFKAIAHTYSYKNAHNVAQLPKLIEALQQISGQGSVIAQRALDTLK